jgi:hypothetical protein
VEFTERLIERNIFTELGKAFASLQSLEEGKNQEENSNITLKIQLIEILTFIVQIQLPSFLDYMNGNMESKILVDGILYCFFYGDQGLQIQVAEMFKFLIDIFHERKSDVLEMFYVKFLPAMSEHFATLERNEQFYSFVQQYVDLLIHCVKFHGYRIRHHIIHNKLLPHIYQGFELNEKSVELSIIKLVKSIITSKDQYLIKHITHFCLLDPIFEIYLHNAKKNNLLDSSCLDLFETIRKENNETLSLHFIRRYKKRIEEYTLQKYFKKLLDAYASVIPSLEEIQDENENLFDGENQKT